MSPHSRTRTALALGAVAIALFGADSARADYTAAVEDGTLTLTGDAADDTLVLIGTTPTLFVDVGGDGTPDFEFDRNTFTAISVLARGGDDEVRTIGSLADEQLTVDGGAGDDTLLGSNGADILRGGSGRDFVDGQQGADVADLGRDNDIFQWDPGDGSDTVDGGDGADVLDFNGSNIGEVFEVTANGDRARLTRNIASIVMDLDGIERAALDPIGGPDAITVGDLTGTDLAAVDTSLDATGGGGDGQPDTVTARGTDADDQFDVATEPGAVTITGLGAQVRATGLEPADDVNVDGAAGDDVATYGGTDDADEVAIAANGTEVRTAPAAAAGFDTAAVEDLVVATGDGPDKVSAVGNLAPLTRITIDGGRGNDTLLGSNGADLIRAGNGDDFVDGQQGADRAELGRDDDTFQWDPGDGSDVVEGGAGADALSFNGSNIGELIDISANGDRTQLTRNIANIVMDLDDVERANLRTLGGADTVTVGDLAGTDLETVEADVRASDGGDDGEVDTVVARGTEAADAITVGETIEGVAAATRIVGGTAQDDLVIEGLGGDDQLAAGVGIPGPVTVNLDGGPGADVATYRGSSGADQIALIANGSQLRIDSPGGAPVDTATEDVHVLALGGDDHVSAVGNIAALTRLTIDGAAGDDTLLGSNGADLIRAGGGDDFVDGQQGADVAELGSGSDTFQWDPGDGNDVVDGESGNDALAFNGSNIGELIDISANGGRAQLTRDIANIVMDLGGLERLGVRALGGTDTVTVGDLSGTGVEDVDVDLALTGGATDPVPDTVVVNGTEKRDVVRLARAGDQALATGLAATTRISGSELLSDTLRVLTHGGDDTVQVSPAVETLITPVIDLGPDE